MLAASLSGYDPERTSTIELLSIAEELDERRAKPAKGWVVVITLVPIDANVERRNGYRQRQHPDWHMGYKCFGEAARDYRQEVGIGDDHWQYMEPRHAQCDVALYALLCQEAV